MQLYYGFKSYCMICVRCNILGMYLEIYLEYTYLSTKNKRVHLLLNDCRKILYICKSTRFKHNLIKDCRYT